MPDREPKYRRQRLIAELVKSEFIATQTQLAERLMERGIRVTQATISRDINELRLVRLRLEGGTRNRHRYRLGLATGAEDIEGELRQRLGLFVRTLDRGGHVVVIKTDDGHAAGIALYLDKLDYPEVVGSVAGQDSIVVVTRSAEAAKAVCVRLEALLEAGRAALSEPVLEASA